jgi:hypothetical protein
MRFFLQPFCSCADALLARLSVDAQRGQVKTAVWRDVFSKRRNGFPLSPRSRRKIENAHGSMSENQFIPAGLECQQRKQRDGSEVVIDKIGVTPIDVEATDLPRPDESHVWRKGKRVTPPLAKTCCQIKSELLHGIDGSG